MRDRHGRDAVATYLGNPNVHSLGSMTHVGQVARALGSRNVYSATSVDQLPQQLVAHLLFGHQLLLPVPDIDRTDYFLVLGANPMASNGSLMTVPDFPQRLRDLKARGGRMVVLDPRRTETAKVATEHHFVRPGTDAAVLLAMLHVLFAEGLAAAARRTSTGSTRCARPSRRFTPEVAEQVSGVPADVVRRLARELAEAGAHGGGAAYGRIGVSTQAFGTVCAWAVSLPQRAHRQPRPGRRGDVHQPAIDVVGPRLRRARAPRQVPQPGARPARDQRRAAGGDAGRRDAHARATARCAALLTVSGNPVLSTPDGKRLDEALAGLDFMVAGRHLPQRDDAARRRDPAADDGAGARPLRPGAPRARGPQHRPVHPGGAAEAGRARGTTGRSSATSRSAC